MDTSEPQWRTSSFSGGSGASCVEVAFLPGAVAVRDTKDRTRSAHRFPAPAWAAFVAATRAGRFAR